MHHTYIHRVDLSASETKMRFLFCFLFFSITMYVIYGSELCLKCTCRLQKLTCRRINLNVLNRIQRPLTRFLHLDLRGTFIRPGFTFDFLDTFPHLQDIDFRLIPEICELQLPRTHVRFMTDCDPIILTTTDNIDTASAKGNLPDVYLVTPTSGLSDTTGLADTTGFVGYVTKNVSPGGSTSDIIFISTEKENKVNTPGYVTLTNSSNVVTFESVTLIDNSLSGITFAFIGTGVGIIGCVLFALLVFCLHRHRQRQLQINNFLSLRDIPTIHGHSGERFIRSDEHDSTSSSISSTQEMASPDSTYTTFDLTTETSFTSPATIPSTLKNDYPSDFIKPR